MKCLNFDWQINEFGQICRINPDLSRFLQFLFYFCQIGKQPDAGASGH